MLCSDLERYLEAFLDGRLGRSRTIILRRHLGLCGPCRARVERLRRFERELGRQLGVGTGQDQPSVWQGLEMDLIRSFSVAGSDLIPLLRPAPPGPPRLRPPAPRAQARRPAPAAPAAGLRRRVSKLGGVLAVALAFGALYELARAWLLPADAAEAAMQAYLDFVAGDNDLALRTDDPASLQHWFATQLGRSFPAPPVPEGFKLVGGGRTELGRDGAAMIVYAPTAGADPNPTLLFVQAAAASGSAAAPTATPVPFERAGYHQLAWKADPYSFRIVSAEPPSRLHEFAP
jgi:anti-sigma factor RsiW